jgi:adenylate cyclase
LTGPNERYRRRLAAVWFADVVEYTRLTAEDEDGALRLVRTFHDVAGDTVEQYGGRVVKRIGDAVMAEFGSTQEAVSAALALLVGFGAETESRDLPRCELRIGIHLGEVTTAPDGDLYGDGVNVAARLHSAAGPGQVVVSDDVARHLRHRREFQLEPLGSQELKGLAEPVAVFAARYAEDAFPAGPKPAAAHARPARLEPSTPPPAVSSRSIAVLPFTNLSPDPENEYFSDGVTEEILTVLAKIEDLKVISRTSAMRYKGSSQSLRQIGEELDVATILEGSVRRAGDRVRIAAQLIDARTDQHLWAERYDRDLEDIFAIQADVAERIVEALRVRLSPRERSRLAGRPTASVEAYQHYLKGLWYWNRRSPEDVQVARTWFEKAIAADPAFAAAHAGLAMSEVFVAMWEAGTVKTLARGREAARRALELDPGLAEGHAALAQIHLFDYDWEGAEREFRLALERNPGAADVRQLYSYYLGAMGRFDEAFAEIARAQELDPLSLVAITGEGDLCILARRYDDAVRLSLRALELDPTFGAARYPLAKAYYLSGRHEESIAEWERIGLLTPEDAQAARAGLQKGEAAYLEGLIKMAPEKGAPPSWVGSACAMVGRYDEAFEWLERAVETHDFLLVSLAVLPLYDPIRKDPRYQRLIERLGLQHVATPSAGTAKGPG